MVSVVKMTTFFMSVFSDPPSVDFERSNRATAASRVCIDGSLAPEDESRTNSLVRQITTSRIGQVIAQAFANIPIYGITSPVSAQPCCNIKRRSLPCQTREEVSDHE